LCTVLTLASTPVRGTHEPLTLDELTAAADTIFLGRVADLRSDWDDTRDGRVIVTRVTFAVERVYKGSPALQTSLEFLGGVIGDIALKVEAMPDFTVGEHDVLFVRDNVRAVNPIVGVTSGRFRVVTDTTGRRNVTAVDAAGVAALPRLLRPGALQETSASLQEFERHLIEAVNRARR
jgi:hypothetical protein